MTTSENAGTGQYRFTLDEFVAKVQNYLTSRNRSSDDCVIAVTEVGLDVCCPVDTDDGVEIVCTNVLDILKPE